MVSMKSWMLGAAMAAGALGLAATPAQAAEFGIYFRGPVAYVPPCPGPGYEWFAGYYANGYWVPGRWQMRDGYYGHGWERRPLPMWDRDRGRHEDFDRRWGRDYGRDRDRR